MSSLLTNTWSTRRAIFEMVPRDMRTSDPTRGAEIAEGYFALGDATIELDGRNLFEVEPPTERFAELLHSFGWIRHMRAHAQSSTKMIARTYVLQWVERRNEHPRIAMIPAIAARRALCLTNQAAYLLDDVSPSNYQLIMSAILADVRIAFTGRSLAPDPTDRCLIALACASVAHSLANRKGLQNKTKAVLDTSLQEAFHPDGGPVSRRPTDLARLLAEMLSLRALMEAREIPVTPRLNKSIASAMRMLRMLRHPDGSLARFQGAADLTHLARGLVASITTYDTERGPLPVLASDTGYARLEAGASIALFDCGGPPPFNAGAKSHASPLAFEWSYGPEKFITNSPAPWQGQFSGTLDRRHTIAHSTVCVDGAASVQFATPENDSPLVTSGVSVTAAKDKDTPERAILARHTGYAKRFGVEHERFIRLSKDGRSLEGKDRLLMKSGALAKTVRLPYAINFHVEPGVRVKFLGRSSCKLTAAMRSVIFEVDQGRLEIVDPSADRPKHGPSRSVQLSVTSTVSEDPEVSWRFIVNDDFMDDEFEPDDPDTPFEEPDGNP
ncbi:MAG: heparinase II/III family protein [Pseudomonadota bacterium]